jgi:competence protein ComEA
LNSPQTSRRHAQPITIGPRHGYQLDGDHVVINAELQIPPQHAGGEWTLELWATEEPYRSGPLTGIKIAPLALELPTPIGPYVHQVDARAAAKFPPQGRAYAMMLALVEQGQDAPAAVHAFANYPERQSFQAPCFSGTVGYHVQGEEVVLQADGIRNPRARDNLSGTLSLELWAFPESGPATEAVRLAAAELGCLAGQADLPEIERRVAFTEPPAGRFQLVLLLGEWTFAHGYVTRDRRDFVNRYERELAPAAPLPPLRPTERLRLVPPRPQEDEDAKAASPIAAARTGTDDAPVSLQTGSLEELAGIKGLNLKLAKEIIKERPFSSVAELVRVRGIGPKTVARLEHLVKV